MTISVKGLGSGLDYDSWIKQLVAVKQSKINEVSTQVSNITKQESVLTSLKTDYTGLLTAIETFTQSYSSDSVFAQKSATSSDEAITAEASSTASMQSIKVSVSSLATATTAQKSDSAAASYVDGSTKISEIAEGAVTEGVFSIYVGGEKHDITIDSDDTLENLLTTINGIDGGSVVSATLSAEGELTISGTGVTVGSTSDTSNFSKVMSLNNVSAGVYTSSKSIFDTDTSAAITATSFNLGAVTTGTFTIGGDEFTIDANTTLDDLIAEINGSEDAGVTAYWDSNSGKLVLTSNDEGAVNINVQAGTSNFTDIMGLTSGGGLAPGSQKLGSNAVLTINDTQITSASNTVTSDISGITGLTLTLNDETTSDATVKITSDTEALSNAVTAFVNAFNTVITNTDTATASYDKTKKVKGALYGESPLNMIRNSLRTAATASVDGENGYTTLASIGITTGAIGTDVNSGTNKLVIDTEKLTAALQSNPEAVKKLLIGDSSTNTDGVLTKLSDTLEKSLDPIKGYFVKREDSYEKQADRLNDKIDKMNIALGNYKTQLEAKFEAMDKLISGLQNSASVFDSYFNKNNKNSDSSL